MSSSVSVAQQVQRCIEANTIPALLEALSLTPTNSLVLAFLARHVLADSQAGDLRAASQAEWYARRALEQRLDLGFIQGKIS